MTRQRKLRRKSPTRLAKQATLFALPRGWTYAVLALVVVLAALVRARMLDAPLERDEGEYAYAGQLILEGVPPYQLAYNMKLPGIYGAYALVLALFGQSPRGVHVGLLLVNAATILLVFALAKKLFGSFAAIVAAACYAILSVSQSVMGTAAHATHFVVLPALGGFLLLLRTRERDRPWMYFVSGVLLGLSFVIKQHGAVFVLFGLLYVASSTWRRRSAGRPGLVGPTGERPPG